jgi:outer membrane lipoprotein carrier protein
MKFAWVALLALSPLNAEKKADAGTPAPVTRTVMAPEVKALVDRMQAFYEKTKDFKAEFRQDYLYKAFKRTVTSTGTVIYKKPGKMRWDYVKPARTFVLMGQKVAALDVEALTLSIAAINTNQLSSAVTFLFGQGKLADEFRIAQLPCDKCLGTVLELVPLVPDPRFQKILLEVDPKTAQVTKSTVIDPDGSENAITFINLKTDVGVDENTAFDLKPPPGVQIVDYTKLGQQQPSPAPQKP